MKISIGSWGLFVALVSVAMSWVVNHSFWWALLHFFIPYIYIPWWCLMHTGLIGWLEGIAK